VAREVARRGPRGVDALGLRGLGAEVGEDDDEGAEQRGDDDLGRVVRARGLREVRDERVEAPVWKSNLQPDFNVRVCDSFDASSSAVLRELDESNRFVQKSAESTSM
jgi:hypothetical protein